MESDLKKYERVCSDAGVIFLQEDGQYVFFLDSITKEQLKVDVKHFNNQKVQAVRDHHRRKYPKHIVMHSDFTDAISFLTKKYYTVPPRVIADAALAATLIIQNHVNEEKNGTTKNAAVVFSDAD